jgi:phosphoribosylanthranilate isomerase
MALSTFVKINNVTNLTDARYGAGMYVNLLGFDLASSSENYVSPELFKDISGWVSGVEFVGEFTDEGYLEILEILENYPAIKWIECLSFEALQALEGKGYLLLYKLDVKGVKEITQEIANQLEESGIIIHVVSENDRLTSENLSEIKKLAGVCKVICGTGITLENVKKLVEETGIYGISLSGSDEIKPGLKDMDFLSEILETLEIED